MAKMYPDRLDPDTDSRAEKKLYTLFRDQLPDTYHVFHSVAWQSRSWRGGARDGEADFVIVHPNQGILVLEAKSGEIRFDGRQGAWFQNDRPMGKSPLKQARDAAYHLIQNTLQEESSYWQRVRLAFGHAVAFPDVVAPDHDLILEAPRPIILDKRNLQNIRGWVEEVFAHYRGERSLDRLSPDALQSLIDLLAPVRELRSLLGVDIEGEAAEFVQLRERQYRVLDYLSHTARAAIGGCAGSGKTMLAAEKARRLAARGWKVLLTCYNRNLADFLRHEYLAERPQTLEIGNFHSIAHDLVQASGQHSPNHFRDDEHRNDYYSNELPDQLIQAVDILGPQFDAIVVDEGQDFQDNWWVPLQFLLEQPDEGTFYIFYDDNQNIYGGKQRVKNLAHPVPLVENCRNTRLIYERLLPFYKGEQKIIALGPLGRNVEVLTYGDQRQMIDLLRRTLHHLVVEQDVPPEDIVLLTPRSAERSHLSRAGRLGNFYLTRNWDTDYNEIYYTTVHSFKGLESPVVILSELDEDLKHAVDELLYVGCSRARHHLVVLCHESIGERFEEQA